MNIPDKKKEVKIITWKYDDVFNAFLVKRVNEICDVHHYYSTMLKLLVQDLKELNKLPLINPTKVARGEDLVNLLSVGLNRLPTFHQTRYDPEDKKYFQRKTSKRRDLA